MQKFEYDYPEAKGEIVCPKCVFVEVLPANYCAGCGKELPDTVKQGFTN